MNTQIDGDKDSKQVKKAKNAVVNGITAGKIKKPDTCKTCKKKTNLEAHHHKGYDDNHLTDVVWLCSDCHRQADQKLRAKKKKKDSVRRFDTLQAPEWMIEAFKRTQEGFLAGRAVVTNTGVFTYQNADGSIRRELRLPAEVFNDASINSLKMKPLTNEHPADMVTSDNAKLLQVGSTGGSPSADPSFDGNPTCMGSGTVYDFPNGRLPGTDRYHLSVDMTFTDGDTISDVVAGKRALSCGYSVDLEETSGVWMGMQYDAIQRNIRYNHVALVDRARAGDAAKILLRSDSADAICTGRIEINKEDYMSENKKTIKIDGMDFQVDPHVGVTLNTLTSRADDLTKRNDDLSKEVSTLRAERDTLKDKYDAVEKKMKDSGKVNQEKLDTAVKERLILIEAAKLAEMKIDATTTGRAIKETVIATAFPRADKEADKLFTEQLAKMDEHYINGRFDAAVEMLRTKEKVNKGNAEKLSGVKVDGNFDETSASLASLQLKNDQEEKEHQATITSAWDREAK